MSVISILRATRTESTGRVADPKGGKIGWLSAAVSTDSQATGSEPFLARVAQLSLFLGTQLES